jgi:hypothetical protein
MMNRQRRLKGNGSIRRRKREANIQIWTNNVKRRSTWKGMGGD